MLRKWPAAILLSTAPTPLLSAPVIGADAITPIAPVSGCQADDIYPKYPAPAGMAPSNVPSAVHCEFELTATWDEISASSADHRVASVFAVSGHGMTCELPSAGPGGIHSRRSWEGWCYSGGGIAEGVPVPRSSPPSNQGYPSYTL
ncbi:hypothetical protein FN846DRAFT_889438 [Sphaerosporella brunnea]|uniref:Ubiquitin 3 binding protein But2 C-terminal domain-containing protein n=1 Tax=Sphaerosporella brunnea TaxID=1250544 RepID=A0A5J5EZX3_9PEZI|nr:hypothetical protein FN846DRAFT_889438 [Sphaerosporella brunnea]